MGEMADYILELWLDELEAEELCPTCNSYHLSVADCEDN